MKQIIPLKKDIAFKTIIGEISNINLDKDYIIKDDIIDGYVNVYGTYKMTDASVIEEEFNYKVPFGVSISKRVKKDSIKIDIDDFNYKFNKDILSVEIDLIIECDELANEDNKESIDVNIMNEEEDIKEEINNEININSEENNIESNMEENINNITNLINNEENYYTYKVYIVRENDTIESICNKYNVSINDLKEYNNLDNIELGDKIVIPYINE